MWGVCLLCPVHHLAKECQGASTLTLQAATVLTDQGGARSHTDTTKICQTNFTITGRIAFTSEYFNSVAISVADRFWPIVLWVRIRPFHKDQRFILLGIGTYNKTTKYLLGTGTIHDQYMMHPKKKR